MNSIKQCASPELYEQLNKDIGQVLSSNHNIKSVLSDPFFSLVENIVELFEKLSITCVADGVFGSFDSERPGCNTMNIAMSGIFTDGSTSGATQYGELKMFNEILQNYKKPLQLFVDFFMDISDTFTKDCAQYSNDGQKMLSLHTSIIHNLQYVLGAQKANSTKSQRNSDNVVAEKLPDNYMNKDALSFFTQALGGYSKFAECVGTDLAEELASHILYIVSLTENQSNIVELFADNTLLYPITRIAQIINGVDKACITTLIYTASGYTTQQVCLLYSSSVNKVNYLTETTDVEYVEYVNKVLNKYKNVLRRMITIVTNDITKLAKSNTCDTLTSDTMSLVIDTVQILRSIIQGSIIQENAGGSARGSVQGSTLGSAQGSVQGSARGSAQGSVQGSARGSVGTSKSTDWFGSNTLFLIALIILIVYFGMGLYFGMGYFGGLSKSPGQMSGGLITEYSSLSEL